MMFLFWGVLGLIQAWLLPGLAITSWRSELTRLDRVLLAIPLSGLVNFLAIEALTLVGGYTRTILLVAVLLEVIVIVAARRRSRVGEGVAVIRAPRWELESPGSMVVAVVVMVTLYEVCRATATEFGGVFTAGDTVMSWNRWAEDWFKGRFPQGTFHYPQLLPAVMSLPYVALGDASIQHFSKIATAVIPMFAFVTGLRAAAYSGARRNQVALGIAFSALLFKRLLGTNLPFSGNADLPVAYMVLAAAYACLLALHAQTDDSRRKLLIIAASILSAAVLTKQAALLPTLAFIAGWAKVRQSQGIQRNKLAGELLVMGGIVLVVGGHWYLYKEIQIQGGFAGEQSEIATVTAVAQLPWLAKMQRAVTWLSPRGLTAITLGVVIAALIDRAGRWVFGLAVLPIFVVWASFFVYDARNFAVGIIPFGIVLSIGLFELIRLAWLAQARVLHRLQVPIRFAAFGLAALVLLIGLAAGSRKYRREVLLDRETELKRSLGEVELNRFLYENLPKLGAEARVGTPYQFLHYLPGLEHYSRLVFCGRIDDIVAGVRTERMTQFLWLPEMCSEPVNSLIREAVAHGELRPLASVRDRILLGVDNPTALVARALAATSSTQR
jgi:hypothetical protein